MADGVEKDDMLAQLEQKEHDEYLSVFSDLKQLKGPSKHLHWYFELKHQDCRKFVYIHGKIYVCIVSLK